MNINSVFYEYRYNGTFRAKIALYIGTALNLCFSAFYFLMSVRQRSYWLMTLAIYYIVLTFVRMMLSLNYLNITKKNCRKRLLREFIIYRYCGILMLIMSVSMIGIVYLLIKEGLKVHGTVATITIAAYTFYCLTVAVINVVKFSKRGSPILAASKNVCLARAIMSLFSLQVTMLIQFDGTDEYTSRFLNISVGFAVCFICLIIALGMIIKSTKNINVIKEKC